MFAITLTLSFVENTSNSSNGIITSVNGGVHSGSVEVLNTAISSSKLNFSIFAPNLKKPLNNISFNKSYGYNLKDTTNSMKQFVKRITATSFHII